MIFLCLLFLPIDKIGAFWPLFMFQLLLHMVKQPTTGPSLSSQCAIMGFRSFFVTQVSQAESSRGMPERMSC